MKTLLAWMLSAATMMAILAVPGNTEAACYRCNLEQECADACQSSSGKNQCSFQVHCGSFNCVNFNCQLLGDSCTGTAECAACSEALEECGIENAGASLIVPNGEAPPGGSWLEPEGVELRVCRKAVEPVLSRPPTPTEAGEPRPSEIRQRAGVPVVSSALHWVSRAAL